MVRFSQILLLPLNIPTHSAVQSPQLNRPASSNSLSTWFCFIPKYYRHFADCTTPYRMSQMNNLLHYNHDRLPPQPTGFSYTGHTQIGGDSTLAHATNAQAGAPTLSPSQGSPTSFSLTQLLSPHSSHPPGGPQWASLPNNYRPALADDEALGTASNPRHNPNSGTAGFPPSEDRESHVGPIRTHLSNRMPPSPSDYRAARPASQESSSMLPDLNGYDDLTGSPTRTLSQSSNFSSRSAPKLTARSLESVQNRLRAMGPQYELPEEVITWGRTLIDMPPEELCLLNILVNVNHQIHPHPNSTSLNASTDVDVRSATPPIAHISCSVVHPHLKGWLRTTLRLVLLDPLLKTYIRRSAKRTQVDRAPFSDLMNRLNQQPDDFKRWYMPENYQKNRTYTKTLGQFIGSVMKSEKNNFANLLRIGFTPTTPQLPVPTLKEALGLIYRTMDASYKDLTPVQIEERLIQTQKARLAYLRAMNNANRLRRIANPTQKIRCVWEDIDEDLEARRAQSPVYNTCFAAMVLEQDMKLWDGKKTIDDWSPLEQELPSDNAVRDRVSRENQGSSA
ncbi:hypothetical protein Pst134EB_002130 [Puccinia striiformis f. sp. tritici]|nr:hypothetical protein Pst134EB_002130 [Puccinia striiformis f. sp. tritici]